MGIEKFLGDVGQALVGGKENAARIKRVLTAWDEEVDRRIDKKFREEEEAKRSLLDAIEQKLRPRRKADKK